MKTKVSPALIGAFVIGAFAVALIALLAYEPRRHEPLIDVRFFRSAPFSSATLIAVCSFSAFSGFLFLNALYLQEVRGLSAFHTGLCTLPLALTTILCSPLSGRLVGSYGTLPSLLTSGTATIVSALLMFNLKKRHDYRPFFLTLLLFALSYGGLGISMWPYLVPNSITIWQAAAPEKSLNFMLVGVAILVPLILAYTSWAYWVFRGKVQAGSGYH